MTEATQDIFAVVKRHAIEVLDADPAAVTPAASITALGGNSLDRAEIAMLAMETLGLRIPRTALVGVANLGELAEVLGRHLRAG